MNNNTTPAAAGNNASSANANTEDNAADNFQTSPTSTDAQILPDEVLVIIVRALVDPWTLVIDRVTGHVPDRSGVHPVLAGRFGYHSEEHPVLGGLPRIRNARLVNSLFRDEIQAVLYERFDGRAILDQTQNRVPRAFHPRGYITGFMPFIRHLTLRNASYLQRISAGIANLPNLTELIIDLPPHHIREDDVEGRTLEEFLEEFVEESSPSYMTVNYSSDRQMRVVLRHFWLEPDTQRIISSLVARDVRIILRLRGIADDWSSAIVMRWRINHLENRPGRIDFLGHSQE